MQKYYFRRIKNGSIIFVRSDKTVFFERKKVVAHVSVEAQAHLLKRAFDELFSNWEENAERFFTECVDTYLKNSSPHACEAFQTSEELLSFSIFKTIYEYIKSANESALQFRNKRKNDIAAINEEELQNLDELWQNYKIFLLVPLPDEIVKSPPRLYITGEEPCDPGFLRAFLYHIYDELNNRIKSKALNQMQIQKILEKEYLEQLECEVAGTNINTNNKEIDEQKAEEDEINELVTFVKKRHEEQNPDKKTTPDINVPKLIEYISPKEVRNLHAQTQKNDGTALTTQEKNRQQRLEQDSTYLELIDEFFPKEVQEALTLESEDDGIAAFVQEKNHQKKLSEQPLEIRKRDLVNCLMNRGKLEKEQIHDQAIQLVSRELELFLKTLVTSEIENVMKKLKKTRYGKETAKKKIAAWKALADSLDLLNDKEQNQSPGKRLDDWKNQTVMHEGKPITNKKLMATHRRFTFFKRKTLTHSTDVLESVTKLIDKIDPSLR